MSELEWLKQDWTFVSMNKQKFIYSVVDSFNKHHTNNITDVK